MFDEGLWTVSEDEKVIVADEIITEWGSEAEWLKVRNGQHLTFLDGVNLGPSRKHLA